MSALEARLRTYVERCGGIDPAHDILHVKRVVARSRDFAQDEPGVDENVLSAAAWLHDINDTSSPVDLRAPSSVRSADIAAQFLRAEKLVPEDRIAAVHHAISAHAYDVGIEPETVEAKILRDADRIDALGAVGVARCFVIGGRFGANLYNEDNPFPQDREPNDRFFIVDHFYKRLLHLKETFYTAAGKREAARRTEFLKGFLDQLRQEIA